MPKPAPLFYSASLPPLLYASSRSPSPASPAEPTPLARPAPPIPPPPNGTATASTRDTGSSKSTKRLSRVPIPALEVSPDDDEDPYQVDPYESPALPSGASFEAPTQPTRIKTIEEIIREHAGPKFLATRTPPHPSAPPPPPEFESAPRVATPTRSRDASSTSEAAWSNFDLQLDDDKAETSSIHSFRSTQSGPNNATTPRQGSPSAFTSESSDVERELAVLLKSPRLTRLITLKRPPNEGLTVSLADVGDPNGHPVIVFLGLGCVRYLIALYDKMAEAYGLRLICLDRWGLGRTTDVPDERRSFMEWTRVVEEVAETLALKRYSLLAHSAGSPYALAASLRASGRIHGSIHLLAPWVSTSADSLAGAYKLLKYVPTGVIKTAQAAEWRMQSWRLGKPPTIVHAPVGYDHKAGVLSTDPPLSPTAPVADEMDPMVTLAIMGGDFSKLGQVRTGSLLNRSESPTSSRPSIKKSNSKSFMRGMFGGGSPNSSQTNLSSSRSAKSSTDLAATLSSPRGHSTSSLVASSPTSQHPPRTSSLASSPRGGLPSYPPNSSLNRRASIMSSSSSGSHNGNGNASPSPSHMTPTRRSSLTSLTSPTYSEPTPLSPISPISPTTLSGADLANGLLRASHAESLGGSTSDLMVLLERTNQPWGFKYSDVEQRVKVWHGDRDDRISLSSVRWLEGEMRDCEVVVVEGADHSMMTNGKVMIDVLESIANEWKDLA